jgi:lipopolysaccharide transport system permease protein
LGVLWWVLEPLLFITTFYFVFTYIRQRGGPDFIIFLSIGILNVQWFNKSFGQGAKSLLKNSDMLNQIKITPLFFPLLATVFASLKQIPILLLVCLLIFGYDYRPHMGWLGCLAS